MVLGHKLYDFSQATVSVGLAQLAICGHSNGSKLFERDGRVDWGGSRNLSKRWSSSSRGVSQFLQPAKKSTNSRHLCWPSSVRSIASISGGRLRGIIQERGDSSPLAHALRARRWINFVIRLRWLLDRCEPCPITTRAFYFNSSETLHQLRILKKSGSAQIRRCALDLTHIVV